MPLLRYDVSVNTNGREKSIHETGLLPAAIYQDDVSVYRVAWHWHEEFELFHLLSGKLHFLIGTNQFSLKAGEAVFINSEMLHGAWDDDSKCCPYHSVVFHPQLIGGEQTSVFWKNYILPLQLNRSLPFMIFRETVEWQADMIELIENVWKLISNQEPGYEFAARNLLSESILQVFRHGNEIGTVPSERNMREEERVKKMLLFMEEHLEEEISVGEIAAAAFISSTECTRCFRNILQTTPIRYLRQLRLRKAENLLSVTTLRVEEIGPLCGFREMSYFARCFRNEYGVPPLTYRQRAADKNRNRSSSGPVADSC